MSVRSRSDENEVKPPPPVDMVLFVVGASDVEPVGRNCPKVR
jgi:hypothetical protein